MTEVSTIGPREYASLGVSVPCLRAGCLKRSWTRTSLAPLSRLYRNFASSSINRKLKEDFDSSTYLISFSSWIFSQCECCVHVLILLYDWLLLQWFIALKSGPWRRYSVWRGRVISHWRAGVLAFRKSPFTDSSSTLQETDPQFLLFN